MAEGSDIAELAGCLAASYLDNPLFGWMFADALNHALLCEIFTGLVEAGLPDHCVYKTRGGGGAGSGARHDMMSGHRLRRPIRRRASKRRRPSIGCTRRAEKSAASTATLVPSRRRSVPTERRRGLASSLLSPVLERSDAMGLDVYLENSDPKNTSFYEGLGFRSTMALPMPSGCPPSSRCAEASSGPSELASAMNIDLFSMSWLQRASPAEPLHGTSASRFWSLPMTISPMSSLPLARCGVISSETG